VPWWLRALRTSELAPEVSGHLRRSGNPKPQRAEPSSRPCRDSMTRLGSANSPARLQTSTPAEEAGTQHQFCHPPKRCESIQCDAESWRRLCCGHFQHAGPPIAITTESWTPGKHQGNPGYYDAKDRIVGAAAGRSQGPKRPVGPTRLHVLRLSLRRDNLRFHQGKSVSFAGREWQRSSGDGPAGVRRAASTWPWDYASSRNRKCDTRRYLYG